MPNRTSYYIAKDGHALGLAAKYLGIGFDDIMPPVVIAARDDRLIGALGTRIISNMVIAGPMRIETEGHKAFVAKKLVDGYEKEMIRLGLKEFWFFVDPNEETWLSSIVRVGSYERICENKSGVWFKRNLYSEMSGKGVL